VDGNCENLKQDKAVEFHNLVAKTLYSIKRSRPNTCTAITFLTTSVRAPDKDEWNKLVHLMRYIRGTHTMSLILSSNGSGILKWWDNATFAVHPSMRGHSGGGLSLGRCFPIVSSTKQKLNARSSTETKIVGADDFMPATCWTRYKSSILSEKNGKA
jgi:hypothetical protein